MADLLAPRDSTIRRLFALSMNRCAFPGCPTPILDPSTSTILAEICHIHAQSEKGPRYNPEQNSEQRHSLENLILMCRVHHKIIDAIENLAEYPAQRLFEIKAHHEKLARDAGLTPQQLTRSQLHELITLNSYVGKHVTHMDFRQAVLNAGGHGGTNGGGGGGGVITIVGTTQLPLEAKITLDGRSPGGGGGAVNFVGRPGTTEDVASGLRISSIFTASSYYIDQGSFHVLGAGWTNFPLNSIPFQASILLVCIVELGSIVENTLIRFDIEVIDPKGNKVTTNWFDAAVTNTSKLLDRYFAMRLVPFEVSEIGVWTFKVSSGGIPHGHYDIEFWIK